MAMSHSHRDFEAFVRDTFGADIWLALNQKWTGSSEGLLARALPSLLEACQEAVGQGTDVKRSYGRYLFKSHGGIARLLSPAMAPSFPDALSRLYLLAQGYPGTCPADALPVTPDFRVEKVDIGAELTSLELHYFNGDMPGMRAIVEGAVQELAIRHFGDQAVKVEWLPGLAGSNNEVWSISFPTQHAAPALPEKPSTPAYCMDASTFQRLHPFHFIMDRQCNIVQAGSVLSRELPALQTGTAASKAFELLLPRLRNEEGAWSFSDLTQLKDMPVVLQCRGHPLKLLGHFTPTRLPTLSTSRRSFDILKSSPASTPKTGRLPQRHSQEFSKPLHSRSNSVQLPVLPQHKQPEQPEQQQQQEHASTCARNSRSCPQHAPLSPTHKAPHSNGAGLPAYVRAYGLPSVNSKMAHTQRLPATNPSSSPAMRSNDASSVISPFARVTADSRGSSAGQLVLLFIGSPCMPSLDALQAAGVGLMDVPPSDRCIEHTLLMDQLQQAQQEKAKMRERLEQLEQQNAAHEAASKILGEALDEALVKRQSANGNDPANGDPPAPRQGQRRSSFRVEAPAEKAMNLLDRLMRGNMPDMQEIMDVRDSILGAAGRDLHNPVKLLDQMAARLSFTGLAGDEEVQASLTQMLAQQQADFGAVYDELQPSDALQQSDQAHTDFTSAGNACRRPSSAGGSSRACSLRRNVSCLGPSGMAPCKASGNAVAGDKVQGRSADGAARAEEGLELEGRSNSAGRTELELQLGVSFGRVHSGGEARRKGPKRTRTRQSMMLLLKPPEGVQQLLKQPADAVLAVLAKVDEWHFNAFEFAEVTNNRPLSTLAFALFSRSGLMPRYEISEVKLARFLVAIEDGYNSANDNPYHNRTHACDVLRTMHVIMTRGGVKAALHKAQDIALIAAYLAAVIHDFDHKGYNNDFLIKTRDALAITYNDRSPMENHHLASAFHMLLGDKQCSAFADTNPKMMELLRKLVVDLVLATDMKQHFCFTSLFNTKVPLLLGSQPNGSAAQAPRRAGKVVQPPSTQRPFSAYRARPTTAGRTRDATSSCNNAHQSVRRRLASPPSQGPERGFVEHQHRRSVVMVAPITEKETGELQRGSAPRRELVIEDEELRTLVMQTALKCADLGHLTHEWEVHKKWVQMLEEEVFRQGDAEKARNLPVSPLMDRCKAGISKSQGGFFSIVVLPQLQSFCKVFPDCTPLLQQAQHNSETWVKMSSASL